MTDRRAVLAGLVGLAAAGPLRATEPPPRPTPSPDRVTLWTSARLAKGASEVFREFERASGIHVAVTGQGTDVAMAGLYTGRADVALLGRPATDSERQAFEWVRQYPATEIALAEGGLPGAPPPVALLVNRRNPVAALSADQLADLLLAAAPRSWRDLDVAGPAGALPVRIQMPEADSGTGLFLRAKLARGKAQLAWQRIAEHPGDDAPAAIASAVARDPAALGFAERLAPGTRTVPILVDGKPLAPDAPGYPLARRPYLYLEQPLDKVRPAVRALADFLAARKAGVA